ncbi:MAG: hypothetical protein ABIK61_00685 [candidate division WOR-3 bacterium]
MKESFKGRLKRPTLLVFPIIVLSDTSGRLTLTLVIFINATAELTLLGK